MMDRTDWSDFERIVFDLQQEVNRQARQLFSETVVREATNPQNVGRMARPDGCGMLVGGCGDLMEIYLQIEDEHIIQASFMTDGCGPTIACGSMLTQMITGVSLEAANRVTAQDLLTLLDGLPPEHVHCADLAVGTLKEALDMYQTEREET